MTERKRRGRGIGRGRAAVKRTCVSQVINSNHTTTQKGIHWEREPHVGWKSDTSCLLLSGQLVATGNSLPCLLHLAFLSVALFLARPPSLSQSPTRTRNKNINYEAKEGRQAAAAAAARIIFVGQGSAVATAATVTAATRGEVAAAVSASTHVATVLCCRCRCERHCSHFDICFTRLSHCAKPSRQFMLRPTLPPAPTLSVWLCVKFLLKLIYYVTAL